MEHSSDTNTKSCECNYFYQYAAALSAAFIMASNGMHHGWPSPSLPILLEPFSQIPTTQSEGSTIVIMATVGGAFGCVTAVLLADRIGRKKSLLLSSPIILLSWLAIAYGKSVLTLIIARFFAGLAGGHAQTVLPMYIAEISNGNIRGLLGSSLLLASKFGVLAINVIGIYFSIKATALAASVFPLLHFVTCCFIPESPRFYILKEKDSKAALSLRKLTKMENAAAEVRNLAASIRAESLPSKNTIKEIFTNKCNRKAFYIILVLFFVEQFSGNFPITFYCLTIFSETGGPIQGSTATILYFSLQFIVNAVCSILLDVTGRKPLLTTSFSVAGAALTTVGIFFYLKDKTDINIDSLSFLPLAALMVCVISFNMGLTTIPFVIMSELFPMEVKASAICILNIFFGVVGVVVTKFFQMTKDEYGLHVPFLVCAVFCASGAIFITNFVPETKGKSLEEIQLVLKGVGSTKTRAEDMFNK